MRQNHMYAKLLIILFFTFGAKLLYFIFFNLFAPHSTILGTSSHLEFIVAHANTTMHILYPFYLNEAARQGPAAHVIPVFIPVHAGF